jgi:hypothetical protein
MALVSCNCGRDASRDPVGSINGATPGESGETRFTSPSEGHVQAVLSLSFDPREGTVEITPDRFLATHLDLSYFWKYYPEMMDIDVVSIEPDVFHVTLGITFSNPLDSELRDVRAIFGKDSDLVPVTIDGWSVRGGASVEDPDPYFAFGKDAANWAIAPQSSDYREVVFKYHPPLELPGPYPVHANFVLDATVDANTAEPFEFGEPELTGRLFHVQISDWQDDITSVHLDLTGAYWAGPLRLAQFDDNERWGTSIPDIPPGDYRLRLTAESPESPGEIGEGAPAIAVHWVELHWPPEDPVIPLPTGQGIYGYSFVDPDTNLPPTDATAFMNTFRNDMGGTWLLIEYGEICNSGYLAMHEWVPIFVDWMHTAAPDLPIHLVLDNLGFQPIDQDPCMHPIEDYTPKFFDNLLSSVEGQILENPDFDNISGLHFDIEVFYANYTEEELYKIYGRYADFLARAHLLPGLNGRNITLYDFDHHPHQVTGDLAYLCTTDAFCGEAYYTRFTWDWNPSEIPTPFVTLDKIIGTYHEWADEYGRAYYLIPGTFSAWIDPELDTLENFTLCPNTYHLIIDEYCFGKGDINTINEFEVVKAHEVHGLEVERVVTELPTGEPIYPANGLVVYNMGDGSPSTVEGDLVYCRTAYGISRTQQIIRDSHDMYQQGTITFRFENNSYWKAAAVSQPLGRGDIAGISGQVRFSDGLSLQNHPELWGGVTIELLDPLTPEILDHPSYRTSIDIVGVVDGSYVFPDLPRGTVTIRAVADGWESDPVTVDLPENFAYRDHIDLIMHPS